MGRRFSGLMRELPSSETVWSASWIESKKRVAMEPSEYGFSRRANPWDWARMNARTMMTAVAM